MFNNILSVLTSETPDPGNTNDVGGFFKDLLDTIVNYFTNNGVDLAIRVSAALLIIVIGHFIVKLIHKAIVGSVRMSQKRKGRNMDMSVATFVGSCVKFVLNIFLIILVFSVLRIPLDNVFSILSAAVLAVGLALQDLLANFANGIVLLTSHSFKTGDYLIVDGTEGVVQEINMLTIVLKSADSKKVVIPNSAVANSVIVNTSAEKQRRVSIDVGVAYGTDVEVARKAMLACALTNKFVDSDPAPAVFFTAYGDSAITVSLRVWCETPNYWDTLFSLNESVYNKFNELGIEIAFPQMDIHLPSNNKGGVKSDAVKALEKTIAQAQQDRKSDKAKKAEKAKEDENIIEKAKRDIKAKAASKKKAKKSDGK